ncbi:MAG: hypothetical protein WA981_05770 [Glaciecola sp.]
MQNTSNIQQHNTNNSNNMSQVSLTKGYWFYFDHEGNDISMFGSAWNGKETVFFNNKPVSSFRNLNKLKSEHTFNVNGNHYRVTTEMTSILRGTLVVNFYCNDILIQTEQVSQLEKGTFFKSFKSKKYLAFLVLCFIGGGLLGYFDLYNRFFG